MQLADLDYPLLRINERGVLKVTKPKKLKRMPETFFNRGGFKGKTNLIDFKCQKYEVTNIVRLRRSWDIDYLLGPHKMYLVEYEIGSPTQLTFEEARESVMELILRHQWFRQGGESREEFTTRFMSYPSMKATIESISGYGTVWY